jgi:hypothetical protein
MSLKQFFALVMKSDQYLCKLVPIDGSNMIVWLMDTVELCVVIPIHLFEMLQR